MTATPAAPTPPRRFGFWTGSFVVVSSMIGSGVLNTSGYILRDTGSPAALLALWALGGLMALAGAVTIAEMAASLPHSGGDYVFVREGFGRSVGFVAGWATFVLGFAGPTAVVARSALTYLTAPYTGWLAETLPAWANAAAVQMGATVLIAVVTGAHCLGQRESASFQVIVTLLKIALMLALGVGGLMFGAGDWRHLTASAWPERGQWPALATGLIYVGYAYSGWNGAGYVAGEVRDPARMLPRVLIGGTLSVFAIYLLVNLAYVFALDPAALAGRPNAEVEPVAGLAVLHLFGPRTADVFSTLIGLSMVATASAFVLTGPRVTFAMARDGFFPAFAGRLHPTRNVPVWATVALGVVSVGLVWSGSFRELLDYTSVGLAAVSGLVVASVFPLRRRRDLERPYRLPLYPLPPLLYLLLVGGTIAEQFLQADKVVPSLLSLGTLLAGVPVGWAIERLRQK